MVKMSSVEINEMVLSAYDSIADSYTGAYADNDDYDAKYLDEFISRLGGNTILDMGCGTGTNTNYLAKTGLDVVGIDASRNMLDVAKKLYPAIRFKKQNVLQTSFEAESFDGVVLAYVINHFNQDGMAVLKAEIDRVLKKHGLLFVSAHLGTSEEIVPDPLDESISIYYNFLSNNVIHELFATYVCEYCFTRQSYGAEEFLCDKIFAIYRK
jgi:ubiquinone/menaquinone biosynthesis C-methylase UbiE